MERYDIPMRVALEREPTRTDLVLQEDACSLLLLTRHDKYKTSVERIADALCAAGVPVELAAHGMWRFMEHVALSWLVGNGDHLPAALAERYFGVVDAPLRTFGV